MYAQQYNKDSVQHIVAAIRTMPVDTSSLKQLREVGYDLREMDSTLSKQLLEGALIKSIAFGETDAITKGAGATLKGGWNF